MYSNNNSIQFQTILNNAQLLQHNQRFVLSQLLTTHIPNLPALELPPSWSPAQRTARVFHNLDFFPRCFLQISPVNSSNLLERD